MIINDAKPDFDEAVSHLRKALSQITTGRADPSLLEGVSIKAYESQMKLQELASITVPEPRALLIEPWDKSVLKEIGAGMKAANLDGQIQMSGDSIRFVIPQMTEENRKTYAKKVGEMIEKARIAVRQIRDRVKEQILKEEKAKEISEDDKFTQLKQLDELASQYNTQIKDIGEQKEKEIFTI